MRAGVTIVDPAIHLGRRHRHDRPGRRDRPAGPADRAPPSSRTARRIGPGCLLEDTIVGEDAVLLHAVCRQAEIGPRVTVGPFAYLRPGTSIAEDAHIGTYVELKKADVGPGAKVPHLTYVGDAHHRRRRRTSARARSSPTTTGSAKHHTDVGEHAFVGSNTRARGAGRDRRRRLHRGGLGDHRETCRPATSAWPGTAAQLRRMGRPQPAGNAVRRRQRNGPVRNKSIGSTGLRETSTR